LDVITKNLIKEQATHLPNFVIDTLEVNPTDKQVYNLRTYIKEFARRRSLSLDVFPSSLTTWLEQ